MRINIVEINPHNSLESKGSVIAIYNSNVIPRANEVIILDNSKAYTVHNVIYIRGSYPTETEGIAQVFIAVAQRPTPSFLT